MGKGKQVYKRKFSVPGNTVQTCKHFPCKKLYDGDIYTTLKDNYGHHEPCIVQMTEQEWEDYAKNIGSRASYRYRMSHCYNDKKTVVKDIRICPYKDKLGKPKDYIVSEKMDGTIVCDCPAGKFNRDEDGNTQCTHRDTAYSNPKKYEIPVESTAKDVDAINAL